MDIYIDRKIYFEIDTTDYSKNTVEITSDIIEVDENGGIYHQKAHLKQFLGEDSVYGVSSLASRPATQAEINQVFFKSIIELNRRMKRGL